MSSTLHTDPILDELASLQALLWLILNLRQELDDIILCGIVNGLCDLHHPTDEEKKACDSHHVHF